MNPNTDSNINKDILIDHLKSVKDDMDTTLENLKAIKGENFSIMVDLLVRTEMVVRTFTESQKVKDPFLRVFMVAIGMENITELPVLVAKDVMKMSGEDFREAVEHAKRISSNTERHVHTSLELARTKVQ